MSDLKISVILANYNHADYISKCLNSLIHQKFIPFEIIIIDDCSTDNSKNIINEFEKKYSFIRAYFNSENKGTVVSQNFGINSAHGNFIYLAASDDYVLEDFFYEMNKVYILNKNIHLITGNANLHNLSNNEKIGERPIVMPRIRSGFISNIKYMNLLRNSDHFILTGSSLIKLSTIKSLGLLNPKFESFADGYLTRVISLKFGFFYLNTPVSIWNIDDQSFSRNNQIDINKSLYLLGKISTKMLYNKVFPKWYIKVFQKRWLFFTIYKNKGVDSLILRYISDNNLDDRIISLFLKYIKWNYFKKIIILFRFFPHSILSILITKLYRVLR